MVHDACRPGERVEIAELATLVAEDASMDTLVLIGCSSTRRLGRHLVTLRPRRRREAGS
jgi:precorrin-3B methylase